MADIADLAQEHMEKHSPLNMATRKPEPPPADGLCLYCDEPVDAGVRFCSTECCRDWEHEQERARINGV